MCLAGCLVCFWFSSTPLAWSVRSSEAAPAITAMRTFRWPKLARLTCSLDPSNWSPFHSGEDQNIAYMRHLLPSFRNHKICATNPTYYILQTRKWNMQYGTLYNGKMSINSTLED